MNKERIRFFADLTITAIGLILVIYVLLRYLLGIALPFLIAWTVAYFVRPLSYKISSLTHIPRKAVSPTLTVLFVASGLALIIFCIGYAAKEAWQFFSGLLEGEKLSNILSVIMNPLGELFGDSAEAMELKNHIADAMRSALSSALGGILKTLTDFASNVPRVLLFILISVVAAIYFSYDIDKINAFIMKILPKRVSSEIIKFKTSFLSALVKYLKAYGILMLITFVLMLIGFIFLKVDYAVLFAFTVALLDALPLIGVGTVLIPWSVYNLLFGKLSVGIGLIVLFFVSTVLRQMIEPKIVGKSLGIHPIVSLILLYLSYSLFGFLGLLLIPILTVAINTLFNKNDASEISERTVKK